MIKYVEGDLFKLAPLEDKNKIIVIPHVCNNQGKWGKGFVVPLGNRYPKAREAYFDLFPKGGSVPIPCCSTVMVEDHISVFNMVAQTLGGEKPLRYYALVECMEFVDHTIEYIFNSYDGELNKVEIHAPAFGSGLAGGDWSVISELIEDIWKNRSVTIYYLPGTLPEIKR